MERTIRFPNLGITLDQVGESVHLFGFEITYYGILICMGILTGVWFMILEAKRNNQNQDRYLQMVLCVLPAGFVGARLFYVLFSWELFSQDWAEIFRVRNGGLAFFGGLLGGTLAVWLFCRKNKLSFAQVADTACMGLLAGQIIGRWGDFFDRSSFGEYTNHLLAMELPLSAVDSRQITAKMAQHIQTISGVEYIRVHPAFLYEILWNLAVLLLLLGIRRKKRFQGEIFLLYLTGTGLGRLWVEYLRTDQLYIPGTQVGISLILSGVMAVSCGTAAVAKEIMSGKRANIRKHEEVENAEFTEESDRNAENEDRNAEEAAGRQFEEPDRHSEKSKTE